MFAAGFVYEDVRWIGAAWVPQWTLQGSPLTKAIWSVMPSPMAGHALSLSLHIINAVLVMRLAQLLWLTRVQSYVAAALFCLHPLTTEGVTYLAALGQLLSTTWMLAACVCLMEGLMCWWVAYLCAVLAFASKETAVMLVPLALVLYEAWQPAIIATVLMCAGVIWMQPGVSPGELAWGYTVLGRLDWAFWQIAAAGRLFWTSVVPNTLTVDYPYQDWSPLLRGLSAASVAALVAVTWRMRRMHPQIAIGLAWALVAISMRLVLVTPRSLLNEHQFYPSMVGLSLVAGRVLG